MKKLGLIIMAAAAVSMTSCKKEPAAAFTMDKTTAETGEVVKFTDNSTDAFNHVWDFGDGEWSTAVSPTHVYYDEGTYTITLQVTDDNGGQTMMATNSIIIEDEVDAYREADQAEKDEVTAQMVGEWDLDDYTISYNGSPTFVTIGQSGGTFYADGTILQTDNNGNLSTGYFSVINSEYVNLSFVQGPSGIYKIDELTETRMTLENIYKDSSLPSNTTVSTLEFSK